MSARRAERRRAAAVAGVLCGIVLVAQAGCDAPPPPATDATGSEAFAGTDTETPPAPLAAGAVRVSVDGERVSLQANEAPRSEVLQALARETGLSLDVGSSGMEDRRITARIDDAHLVDVLSLVLRGVDYELAIGFDRVSQAHRVAVLRVRPSSDAARGAFGSPAPRPEEARGATLYDLLDSDDPLVVEAALDALARAGDPLAAAEIEPLLDDEDPGIRAAAADALDALELEPDPAP